MGLGCSSAITCCPAAAKCILPSTILLLCLSALLLSCAVLHKTALACYHLLSTCQVGLSLLLLLYSDHCAVLHKIKTLFCCAVSLFTLCCFLVHSVLCCAGPLSVWLVVLLLRSAGQTDQWQLSLQWADKPQHGPSHPRPPTPSSPPPPPSSRTSAVS